MADVEDPWSEYNQILKSVSRSFYLSIKFLPVAMREPIALGYLLARLSDTIADAGSLPIRDRISLLDQSRERVDLGNDTTLDLETLSQSLEHRGEQELCRLAPQIYSWFDRSDEIDQALVRNVLHTIIDGQTWDLEFFEKNKTVQSEEQLLHYTYQVAGCVGEFWTDVGYTKLGEKFASNADRDDLMFHGKALGQGLQLINIIRDLHEDIPQGRNYLPSKQVAQPEIDYWLGICRQKLNRGRSYVKKLKNRKVKFATAMPWLLARKTADKLEEAGSELILTQKIKVSRGAVLKTAIQSALFV